MTTKEINEICLKYNITNYTINEDLSIDVDGSVDLCDENLNELPLRFLNVSGEFDCSWNSLTSLEGTPSKVGRSFYCIGNRLTTLVGSPSSVYGKFYCYGNPLESLKGIPLKLSKKQLYLPYHYTYNDYLTYCRDSKFKKLLK